MQVLKNPFRGQGIPPSAGMEGKQVKADAQRVLALLEHCPAAKPTSLIDSPELAAELGIARLYLKDERERMGLGSFKASGAAWVIALAASERIAAMPDTSLDTMTPAQLRQVLQGETYLCASAGNHGLSVAAGCRVFGAQAVIYLSHTVPESFAERLRNYGAEVVRAGDNYEASMSAAMHRAAAEGWILLSDSSWPDYTEIPTQVMEGYLVIAAEAVQQIAPEQRPTHLFLQAGVGGLAAAMAAGLRQAWGQQFVIVVAEPDAAPALLESIRAGQPVITAGPVSSMGRLDCKEPSHLALACLAKEADWFISLNDASVQQTVDWLGTHGIATTPSASAGLAVVQQSRPGDALRTQLGLDEHSRVMVIISEQA